MNDKKSIVVLIDYDNFSLKYFKILQDELNEIGDIVVSRAYGNFDSKTKKEFSDYGINPILQTPYTKGKNATDIRMTIEAMDFLSKGMFDCFCLATSDSDFTPLAIRLKEEKKHIIGAGEKKTPDAFKKICHHFINVDEILENRSKDVKDGNKDVTIEDESIKELVDIVNEIIENQHDDDDYAQFSRVIEFLQKQKTDFNPKNYGASNRQSLAFFRNYLNRYYDFKTIGSTDYIKMKIS